MVGLSDIPCVGIVVNRISEAIVDIAFRGSRYLLCTKNLVKDLNSQVKKVEILENESARKVDEATNDGKIVEGHVLEWQENVKNIKTQVAEISGQTTSSTCFGELHFPNPVERFRLGRRAAHLVKTVTEQTNYGKEFLEIEIAHRLPIENLPGSDTPYQSFGSRQVAYAKLWDSIVNEDGCPTIGIYGMPGVGKTRIMEQVWQEAVENGIFNKVTRANIGAEKINVTQLQDQLAGYLDCHLESKDNEINRASQLKNSLMSGGKTLLILDDVWDDIPLNEIGIPFADGTSKGCKILLTSRRKDVCLRNNCQDPIEINPLTITEAWDMFKNTVGTSKIESFQDALLAEKVCKECGALPLLIHAVGKALKFGTENTWKDALHQLENQKFKEIDGIDAQVYACLQLSFVKLMEGARRCLLLCALFPEDADIDIKELFDIATASELLDPERNIRGLVDILQSSSLLHQGKDDDTVKLHDVIRDVARYVAATDSKYAFLYVRCKSRWPNNADYPTRRLLQVDLEGENIRFPDDLVCQDLHTLWLRCNSYVQNRLSSFFKGLTNLKVVVLQSMGHSREERFSIHTLDKLLMLSLEDCRIDQVFLNSVSKTLETLSIWNCYLPSPLDIPEFKDLIKLELVQQHQLHVVATSISKLTRLEELNVPGGFATNEDDSTDISAELSTLNYLRNLTINFRQSKSYPSNIVDNLVEFKINVGIAYNFFSTKSSVRRVIRLGETNMKSGWMPLLERAEVVELTWVKRMPNGLSDSCNTREAFANLRELKIQTCYGIQHIGRWDGNNQHLNCFINLRNLYLNECNGLKYLFSSGIANCLRQLQILSMYNCHGIEEIFRSDDGQEVINFPKLNQLRLDILPKLTCIYNNKVELPQLKVLKVKYCAKLEIVTRCTMLHGFENLAKVKIVHCESLKTVFHSSSPANPNMVFPGLKKLYLYGLPNLESFLSYDNELLEIDDSKSYTLFTSTVFRSFRQLRMIKVSYCHLLKEIVEDGDETNVINQKTPISLQLKSEQITLDDTDDEIPGPGDKMISLPLLETIQLERLHGLKSFSSSSTFTFCMPLLNYIWVHDCPCMDKFTFLQMTTPLLEGDLKDWGIWKV